MSTGSTLGLQHPAAQLQQRLFQRAVRLVGQAVGELLFLGGVERRLAARARLGWRGGGLDRALDDAQAGDDALAQQHVQASGDLRRLVLDQRGHGAVDAGCDLAAIAPAIDPRGLDPSTRYLTGAVALALADAKLKLRGEVRIVAPGSLPNDGKVIEDARSYK